MKFEGQEWITVRQAGEKLGLDERAITKHFEQFPYELSVLSTKLTGDRLKTYKLQYPGSGFTPDELNESDAFSSFGVGVIGDQSAHERAYPDSLASRAATLASISMVSNLLATSRMILQAANLSLTLASVTSPMAMLRVTSIASSTMAIALDMAACHRSRRVDATRAANSGRAFQS